MRLAISRLAVMCAAFGAALLVSAQAALAGPSCG
jgi:hypothetical protein